MPEKKARENTWKCFFPPRAALALFQFGNVKVELNELVVTFENAVIHNFEKVVPITERLPEPEGRITPGPRSYNFAGSVQFFFVSTTTPFRDPTLP